MEKSLRYNSTRFDAKMLAAVLKAYQSLSEEPLSYNMLTVEMGQHTWKFDTIDEFLAGMDQGNVFFMVHARIEKKLYGITVTNDARSTYVSVGAKDRDQVESIFKIFDENAERCRHAPAESELPAKIFIGHGRNPQWKDLKDHLHEKHGYLIEAYEIGSRAGHTIRDVLEDMLDASMFALLVMTGEDDTADGKTLARQNVVHEAGLFQGRLGFSRTIILLEEGTEEFSNIHGVQQIRFAKGNIKESFGDVLAVLKREIG